MKTIWQRWIGWFLSKDLGEVTAAAEAGFRVDAQWRGVGKMATSVVRETFHVKSDNTGPYAAIDVYIGEQMRRLKIPGAFLAIVEGDQLVHLRGFGSARPGGGAPSPQTPFFIGSLTKSFTALAVMQLVEAGRVELQAPVQRYLPWFRVADLQASAQIEVRHLLHQTSGLPMSDGLVNLGNFDSRPDATQCQARALSALKLARPVGAQFEYSNLNYNILGLIVEAASGESYAGYIQRHIFDPLDMRHSYTSKAAAQRDGLAVGHRYWFGHPFPVPNLAIPAGSLPSGQLVSSAEDMARYLIAHLNGGRCGSAQILSQEGINELLRGVAEINAMGLSLGKYAMGWISLETGPLRIVSHSGIVPDFSAFMALVPEQKKGLVLLFNANHAVLKLTLDEVGMSAAKRLAGELPSPNRLGGALWVMRGLLLIPILQVAGVIATLRLLRRWRTHPSLRPNRGRMWRQHLLLPLIPNLLGALTLLPMMGKLRGFVTLFMPDFSWIARISGGVAGIWAFLGAGVILRTLRKSRSRYLPKEVNGP
jgi:CubicO group peptidase (beta-lactamase class C family)